MSTPFRFFSLSLCLLMLPCVAMENSAGGFTAPKPIARRKIKRSAHTSSTTARADNDTSLFSSESDSEYSDEEATAFIVHIANEQAASFYVNMVKKYNGKVNDWRRDQTTSTPLKQNEDFFARTRGAQDLCEVLAGVCKKLKIKPEIVDGVPNGTLVRLKTNEPQSLARIRKACKKSFYVYDVETADHEEELKNRIVREQTSGGIQIDLGELLGSGGDGNPLGMIALLNSLQQRSNNNR